MPQFYLPPPWETQKPHPLPAELLHHLRVRRISEGEVIPIFDGQGQIASATLVRLGNKSGELTIANRKTGHAKRAALWHHPGPRPGWWR
jgi:16S rRNA (uracil1498-N3)-methyltransferase